MIFFRGLIGIEWGHHPPYHIVLQDFLATIWQILGNELMNSFHKLFLKRFVTHIFEHIEHRWVLWSINYHIMCVYFQEKSYPELYYESPVFLFIFGKIPCPVRLFYTVRLLDPPRLNLSDLLQQDSTQFLKRGFVSSFFFVLGRVVRHFCNVLL